MPVVVRMLVTGTISDLAFDHQEQRPPPGGSVLPPAHLLL
jgi:hypothetical protein